MNKLSNYVLGLSFLVFIIFIFSLFLPSELKINHTEYIYSSQQSVFEQLNTIRNWGNWNVWSSRVVGYSDVGSGPGAFFTWNLKEVGSVKGKLEIITSQPNESITFKIQTDAIDSVDADVYFKAVGYGTEVHWSSSMKLEGTGVRLIGFFLKRWLIRDIKISLRNINDYFLQSKQYTGWISGHYTIAKPMRGAVYYINDTVSNALFDSSLDSNHYLLVTAVKEKYNYTPEVFFYKKLSVIDLESSVYMFGVNFTAELEQSAKTKEFFNGYLNFNYLGSNADLSQVNQLAKEVSEKENLVIDTFPFVVFNKFPLEGLVSDTSKLIVSYPIITDQDD